MEHNYRTIAACVCMLAAISLGMGCGADSGPLGVDPSSELDFSAEAIATVAGNSIDAELLALANDIEEVVDDADAVFPPPHPPPPKLDRLRTEFNLTDDQTEQINVIVTTTRDRLKSNFEAVRDGSLTKEEAKTEIDGIRSDTKAQIEQVLTAEQLERFPGAADRLTAVATFVPPSPPHRPPGCCAPPPPSGAGRDNSSNGRGPANRRGAKPTSKMVWLSKGMMTPSKMFLLGLLRLLPPSISTRERSPTKRGSLHLVIPMG